jgi:hypothetical protein
MHHGEKHTQSCFGDNDGHCPGPRRQAGFGCA